jgi:hypothetical protein
LYGGFNKFCRADGGGGDYLGVLPGDKALTIKVLHRGDRGKKSSEIVVHNLWMAPIFVYKLLLQTIHWNPGFTMKL